MAFRKIVGSYKDYTLSSHIIEAGYLAVDTVSGDLRIGDGSTPGGTLLASGSVSQAGAITFYGTKLTSPSNGPIELVPGGTGNVLFPSIQFHDNEITARNSNEDLILTGSGTGKVQLSGLSFPTSDGSAGQFLQTDGSGTLSFASVSVGDFSFIGSTMISPSNADITLDPSGSGGIELKANTTITGNLNVTGTQTTLETTTLVVEDPLLELAKNNSSGVANVMDLGLFMNRGSSANVSFLWDESADEFVTAVTSGEDGTTSGNVTIDSYASLKVGALNVQGAVTITSGSVTGITDITVADGGTGASSFTDGGVLLGSGTGAITAMAELSDGEMIVGDGSGDPVAESGATLRTSIGVGTGDSPQFTGIEVGHASDTTLTKASSGDIAIEGNIVYRAGGTDVPVSDGGTGASSLTDNAVLTGTGSSAITAEGNLSFNGSTLAVTGAATVSTNLTVTGIVQANNIAASDSSSVAFQSPVEFQSTVQGITSLKAAGLTYPTSDGSAGQFMKTDGSGNLSFATVSIGDLSIVGATIAAPSNAPLTLISSGSSVNIEGLSVAGNVISTTDSSAGVEITGNLIPSADGVYQLGSESRRWQTAYLSAETVNIGGATISSDSTGSIEISATGATLPTGSKVGTRVMALNGSTAGTSARPVQEVPLYVQDESGNVDTGGSAAITFEFNGTVEDIPVFTEAGQTFVLSTGATFASSDVGITQFQF